MPNGHHTKEIFLNTGNFDDEIKIYEPVHIDPSIAIYIEKMNALGYLTENSCSGLNADHTSSDNMPYIFFRVPKFIHKKFNVKHYFGFLTYVMEQSGFIPIQVPKYGPIKILIGFLPFKLSDFGLLSKFQVLYLKLEKRDFFNTKQSKE